MRAPAPGSAGTPCFQRCCTPGGIQQSEPAESRSVAVRVLLPMRWNTSERVAKRGEQCVGLGEKALDEEHCGGVGTHGYGAG